MEMLGRMGLVPNENISQFHPTSIMTKRGSSNGGWQGWWGSRLAVGVQTTNSCGKLQEAAPIRPDQLKSR